MECCVWCWSSAESRWRSATLTSASCTAAQRNSSSTRRTYRYLRHYIINCLVQCANIRKYLKRKGRRLIWRCEMNFILLDFFLKMCGQSVPFGGICNISVYIYIFFCNTRHITKCTIISHRGIRIVILSYHGASSDSHTFYFLGNINKHSHLIRGKRFYFVTKCSFIIAQLFI